MQESVPVRGSKPKRMDRSHYIHYGENDRQYDGSHEDSKSRRAFEKIQSSRAVTLSYRAEQHDADEDPPRISVNTCKNAASKRSAG